MITQVQVSVQAQQFCSMHIPQLNQLFATNNMNYKVVA